MPQTRQHIYGERPLRPCRYMEGVVVTEEIQRFLTAYEGMSHSKETI